MKTGADRKRLYEKGTKLYRRGRQDLALKYLLRCITGLDETSGFTFLPQCLHHVRTYLICNISVVYMYCVTSVSKPKAIFKCACNFVLFLIYLQVADIYYEKGECILCYLVALVLSIHWCKRAK